METAVRIRRVTPQGARPQLEERFSCYVGVSLENPSFRGLGLMRLLDWAKQRSLRGLVVLGDCLHRFNLMAEYDLDSQSATEAAEAQGDAFLQESLGLWSLLADKHFSLLRWRDLIGAPSFPEALGSVRSAVAQHDALRTLVHKDAIAYVLRRVRRGTNFSAGIPRAVELAEHYITEEVAGFAVLAELGFTVDLYPGRELAVLQELAKRRYSVVPEALYQRVNVDVEVQAGVAS